MNEGPYIAEVASLIGDPARANMLCALLDGRAHTASELALVACVRAPAASAHLAKLVAGGLLTVEKQGRHRYYRIACPEAAAALEALSALAPSAAPRVRRPGPRDAAMRHCRTCYDHLAGRVAVDLTEAMIERGWLVEGEADYDLTDTGRAGLGMLGVETGDPGRRRFASRCLDWSERRAHLGGALGARLLETARAKGWIETLPRSRAVTVTPAGIAAFGGALGVTLPEVEPS